MGNFYCNKIDIENMNIQYHIAERLAQTLGDHDILRTIQYNRASACLEAGNYGEAYAYFSQEESPTMMDLHKLAICCEKLGRRIEAFEALDRAAGIDTEYPELKLSQKMFDLVRFRLEHEDYLQCPQYGEQLLYIFDK